jgi:hypothetical protein
MSAPGTGRTRQGPCYPLLSGVSGLLAAVATEIRSAAVCRGSNVGADRLAPVAKMRAALS